MTAPALQPLMTGSAQAPSRHGSAGSPSAGAARTSTATLTLVDPSLSRRSFVEPIFGLPVTISLRGYALHRRAVVTAVEDTFDALRHFDSVFAMWRPESDISRLARGEVSVED